VQHRNNEKIARKVWRGSAVIEIDSGLAMLWHPAKILMEDLMAVGRIIKGRFRELGSWDRGGFQCLWTSKPATQATLLRCF
jgi:hypothetical protein